MTQHLHTACAKAAGLIGLLLALSAPVAAATLQTFNNAAAITIPGSGNATPYPSAITVSGVPTNFTRLEVQLNGFTHSFPDDVDVLLVGPQGQRAILMSDACGGNPGVTNLNLTFAQTASAAIPDSTAPSSGLFRPANYAVTGATVDTFPAPGPGALDNAPADLSAFNGFNPNGVWNLFVVDDADGDQGAISGGWTLRFTVPELFTVSKTADTNDGACNADCSLREAITAAQNGDLINFSALFNTPQTINLLSALPDLTRSISIQGPGANRLTVRRDFNAATAFRIFTIAPGASNGVTISGMTMTGGVADNGGGIRNDARLTLNHVAIIGNTASNFGGGIFGPSVSVVTTVANSTLSGNTAGASQGTAGAIDHSGDLMVMNSTISGNTASNGNSNGGGIWIGGVGQIVNTTVTQNSANGAASASGVFVSGTSPVSIRNSIVAGNSNNTTLADVVGAGMATLGFNLIGNPGAVSFTATGDQFGTGAAPLNPRLGALQNNGGNTHTHALLLGSPALDRGNRSGANADQRGYARPVDLEGIANTSDGGDIGAFEAQSAGLTAVIFTQVAAGDSHTCGLTTGGGVKCWGRNFNGQLGDGTTTDRLAAVDVSGLSSGVSAIALGDRHTCALTSTGGVKCWGNNSVGQLGDGTTTARLTPVDVTGLTSGVSAVVAGEASTCALTTGGGVKCWGAGANGRLGDGTTMNRLTAVDVSGLTSGVSAIAAGLVHTCAITIGGGAKCWGFNGTGQLGDGTTVQRLTAVDVSGLGSGVSAISPGGSHTCALTTGGGVKCWGFNGNGQLGDGTTVQSLTPVDVSGLGSGVSMISSGGRHTCALTTGGGAKCWGFNSVGQLGDGTLTNRLTPIDVSGLTRGVSAIGAASGHTCAVANGGIQCWGSNGRGELGDGTTTIRRTAVEVSGLTSGISAITGGFDHTCALSTGGGVKCWGRNADGQLGDNTTIQRLSAVDVSGLTSGVSAIAAGNNHTCALASGGVKCWGNNNFGQLGDGSTTTRLTPVDVSGLTMGVSAISAGGSHTCALTTGGGVKCWGNNGFGRLGDGTTTTRLTAVDVTGLSSGVSAIGAGGGHSCALTTGGGVKCWGRNVEGQLGDGTTTNRLTEVDVSGLTSGVSAIDPGEIHACAITTGGGVKCWGSNQSGRLGDGTTTTRLTPVDVSGLTSGVSAVAASLNHTCALTTGGGVKCWGFNTAGELGDGSTEFFRTTAVDVSGLTSGVSTIATGGSHTCARTTGGGVKCWGFNGSGQLGIGGRNYGLPGNVLIDLIFANRFENTP
ncbi:MAG: CSLREA domain-containing protein [Xanthomonadales bacterium]|jgi:CSLREA domain-containing protein|nr:CSLREA domain-containing protein [Xanthomonadales bacterium]